jgi:PIN domain nuclease of toxin-antitoxin system
LFREFVRDLTVLPFGLEECRALSRRDFESDPADEIIAATSLARNLPLVTRDRGLRRSKIVPLAL